MVNKNTRQLRTNRAMQKRRRHRRIHAARQPKNHVLVADLRANLLDRFIDVMPHLPVRPRATQLKHEAIGQAGVDAISLNPTGMSDTLSPWLIHTFSMPWPSAVWKSSMPFRKLVWLCARTSA